METLLGGLNYQIEHHLFPSMPRPSLRQGRDLVRAYCAQRGLPCAETGLAASYAEVLRTLHHSPADLPRLSAPRLPAPRRPGALP